MKMRERGPIALDSSLGFPLSSRPRGDNVKEGGVGTPAMDPPFPGFVLDPSKCRNLSIEEKSELIRELFKWPESALEKLQTWSRRELLEILCVEMGKQRKYTGLTKQKMIEHLFRVVSEKKSQKHTEDIDTMLQLHPPPPPPETQILSKRQRKTDHPSRLPTVTNNFPLNNGSEDQKSIRYCLNLACRATVNQEDVFCKRCSCCICHKYDDNKDPSLWLVCSSESPFEGDPCGLSCHLECALKHERSGISNNVQFTRLDGSFYCICCGKVNDLLRCWRKQLIIAKEARRVDVLCYRVSLSHKVLSLTDKYRDLHEIVDEAMKKLQSEVGPLNGLPNMARGIVNRLSVGAEVQRLCAHAVELLDSMFSGSLPAAQIHEANLMSSNFIKLDEVSPTSVTVLLGSEYHPSLLPDLVGFALWHRKVDTTEYPTEPACKFSKGKRRFLVTDLIPATEYKFKIIAFGNMRELAKWEVGVKTEAILKDVTKNLVGEGTSPNLGQKSPKTNSSGMSNPSTEGDESNNTNAYGELNNSPDSIFGYHQKPQTLDLEKLSDHAYKDTSGSQNTCIDTTSAKEAAGQEQTPGISGSTLDEELNSTIQTESHRDSTNSIEHNQVAGVPKLENKSNACLQNDMVIVPYGISKATQPVTPCRLEIGKEGSGRTIKGKPGSNLLEYGSTKSEREPGSSSKKRNGGTCENNCIKDGLLEGAYEYCVKMIRWLECEGLIETNFRVKFLTWFSLRATPQERKVVNVYVDTLIDDPASLAGQLVDTFSEAVCSTRPPLVPTGFCMRLWH